MSGRLAIIAVLIALWGCDQQPSPLSATEIAEAALRQDFAEDPAHRVDVQLLAEVSEGPHRLICGRSSRWDTGYPPGQTYGLFVVLDGRLVRSPPSPGIEELAQACLAKIPRGLEIRPIP